LIALLRNGPNHHAHYLPWALATRLGMVDVTHQDAVVVRRVNSEGRTDVLLSGIPLDRFCAVIYLGVPGGGVSLQAGDRDRLYSQTERNAALMAGLWSARFLTVLNAGQVFCWNRSLLDQSVWLRELSNAGCSIPDVEATFAFAALELEQAEAGGLQQRVHSLRHPEAHPASQRLLVVGRGSKAFLCDPVSCELGAEERVIEAAVREILDRYDFDWMTCALGGGEGKRLVYGARPELPSTLSPGLAAQLIDQAIRARGPRQT
jgi:hypothetical protein